MPPRQTIQRSVHERHHRVVTGANLFARSVGSAVFGAIVNSSVERGGDTPPHLQSLPPSVLEPAIHDVYWG